MARGIVRVGVTALTMAAVAAIAAAPASAYLYWKNPAFAGAPATGAEPGLVVALPDATPKEMAANLMWSMRAGLNVAALQCQFSPVLRTVPNYNGLLKQHAAELQTNYNLLQAYFKRMSKKNWQNDLDQYTTRTYNSFSTMHAQISFCDTAAAIGRDALDHPRGKLAEVAATRMREFRNALVPSGDQTFAFNTAAVQYQAADAVEPACFDKKGREVKCKVKKK